MKENRMVIFDLLTLIGIALSVCTAVALVLLAVNADAMPLLNVDVVLLAAMVPTAVKAAKAA